MITKEHRVSTAEARRNISLAPFLFGFFERNKPSPGNTMDGISYDDDTARCFHSHTFSLSMHNMSVVEKDFNMGVCPAD